MEAILNLPLQAAQARVDPPPKPSDPTRGYIRSSYGYNSQGEFNAEPYRNINGYILRSSSAKGEATKGTIQEMGQDEFDSDPLKARIGRKPKERRENVPQLPQAPDHLTQRANFRSHPSGKPPHLEREVRNFTEPD